MDATKLNCPPLSAEDEKRIVSTRIRVGRNLADFPLGPQLTKEQRHEVEEKVVKAVESFEGELKGKYYSLASLSDEERK
jgi:arginine kinase